MVLTLMSIAVFSLSALMCRMACVGWKLGLLVLAAALSVVVGPSEARRVLGECAD